MQTLFFAFKINISGYIEEYIHTQHDIFESFKKRLFQSLSERGDQLVEVPPFEHAMNRIQIQHLGRMQEWPNQPLLNAFFAEGGSTQFALSGRLVSI